MVVSANYVQASTDCALSFYECFQILPKALRILHQLYMHSLSIMVPRCIYGSSSKIGTSSLHTFQNEGKQTTDLNKTTIAQKKLYLQTADTNRLGIE
jgi:hypothetical protein